MANGQNALLYERISTWIKLLSWLPEDYLHSFQINQGEKGEPGMHGVNENASTKVSKICI